MKINLLILFFLFFSCITTDKKLPENIIPKETFITILKEIHLADAAFNLTKSKDIENAENILQNTYLIIYSNHNINQEIFQKTLSYYASNPEELEEIYSKVLRDLIQENANLNP